MTRVEELIRDYKRAFNKIGNSEVWRAILLLYTAAILMIATRILRNRVSGTGYTLCRIGFIVAIVGFLAYCVAMAVIVFSQKSYNYKNGEKKMIALLLLMEEYRINWRDKEAVRRLIAESDRAKKRARLDLTILPRLAGLLVIPCAVAAVRYVRSLPVPDLMLDVIGKAVVVLEVIAVLAVMVGIFAFVEWLAGRVAAQYRDQASAYGVFSQQARQLLVFEQSYLEELLAAAKGITVIPGRSNDDAA